MKPPLHGFPRREIRFYRSLLRSPIRHHPIGKRPLRGLPNQTGANGIHQNVPGHTIQGFFASDDMIVKSLLPERGNLQTPRTRCRGTLEIPHRPEKIGGGAIANEQDMKMIRHETVSVNVEAMPRAGIPQNKREFLCKFFTREKRPAFPAADGHKITARAVIRSKRQAVGLPAGKDVAHSERNLTPMRAG